MGEIVMLINEIRDGNKDAFCILMDKMQPLINKYSYSLYKDNREDIQSELYIALWEAVKKISFVESDGQVINYLTTAIKHRFFELYRASKKEHDYESLNENDEYFNNLTFHEYKYDDFSISEDLKKFISKFDGIKKNIYHLILIENKNDSEIAKELSLSRQYVNRIRRQLRKVLQQYLS